MGTATLDTRQGEPCALHWHGRTWLVTDAPTRIEEALDALLTHPVATRGWRFQGTEVDGGETLVFDVLASAGGWQVVKTYT
jgi:hypothetical protein